MKYSEQPLQTFRLRNFKAVRDSGVVKFTPLTVFIGNNGSGKSSLIEGLETFQSIIIDGLDEAMNKWRGFEFIWNQAPNRKIKTYKTLDGTTKEFFDFPMGFSFKSSLWMKLDIEISATADLNSVFIAKEKGEITGRPIGDNLAIPSVKFHRDSSSQALFNFDGHEQIRRQWSKRKSAINITMIPEIERVQFLRLLPEQMGQPRLQDRVSPFTKLNSDGSNISQFLFNLTRSQWGINLLSGIIETVSYVLPYSNNLETKVTSELERMVYLQLSEQDFKVPGWLLSTGTLRVLALLALLRHPNPPPLLCIEEIENGLDSRTLNLIVEEIARATQSGKTQVICTTHSPYFLDLVPLSSIIVVERDKTGQPTFTRPDAKALGEWATKFAPGQLYTMSQLTRS